MGKSYRKNPIIKEGYGKNKKARKRTASKKVRSIIKTGKEMGSGSEYKKYYETWNIDDFAFRMTEAEAIKYYERHCRPEEYSYGGASEDYCNEMAEWFKEKYPTVEDFLNWWKKVYVRK